MLEEINILAAAFMLGIRNETWFIDVMVFRVSGANEEHQLFKAQRRTANASIRDGQNRGITDRKRSLSSEREREGREFVTL